jgi:putative copper export protein
MDVLTTTVVLVGLVLLVGGGTFARWIAAPAVVRTMRRTLVVGVVAGAALTVAGSLADVALTVARFSRGAFDPGFAWEYLIATRHGRGVAVRVVLAIAVAAWGVRRYEARRLDTTVHAGLVLAVLATVAWESHSGAMGALAFVADLVHLVAATTWAGSLAFLALAPVWDEPQGGAASHLPRMVRRISRLGLTAVVALFVTGTFMSLLHVYALPALTATPYGVSLMAKLTVVALIVALAGVNRWFLVPLVERGVARPLLRAVRVESLALALVLVATAVLTTREPAHEPATAVHGGGAIESGLPAAAGR